MLMAIFLGAITVSVIDHQFRRAAIFALTAVGFSFVGLMHAPKLTLNAAPDFVIGYLVMAAMLIYFEWQQRRSL